MYLKVASSYRSNLGRSIEMLHGKVTIKAEPMLLYHSESDSAFWAQIGVDDIYRMMDVEGVTVVDKHTTRYAELVAEIGEENVVQA